MVIGRQFVLRNLQIVNILEVKEVLGVLILIVLFPTVESEKYRPGQASQKWQDADSCVDTFTTIATLGIGEVVKLNKAEPHCSQELIPPNLICKVDNPPCDVVYEFVEESFLLVDEVTIYAVPCCWKTEEP